MSCPAAVAEKPEARRHPMRRQRPIAGFGRSPQGEPDRPGDSAHRPAQYARPPPNRTLLDHFQLLQPFAKRCDVALQLVALLRELVALLCELVALVCERNLVRFQIRLKLGLEFNDAGLALLSKRVCLAQLRQRLGPSRSQP